MRVIEQKPWHNHQLLKQVALDQANEAIPFLTILPANAIEPLPWIIASHGYTSSKGEWLEFDDYTKGGNLVKALADNGYAVIAVDLYYHGDNHPDPSIGTDDLVKNEWERFFRGSVESVEVVVNDFVRDDRFDQDRIGFLSYSMGGQFGFWLANREAAFKTMVMCVPQVDRNEDDAYAPRHNLSNLTSLPILLIAAQEDEYIPFEDSEWLYAQLPTVDKQLLSYRSGHSLPVDYVPAAVAWFKKWL